VSPVPGRIIRLVQLPREALAFMLDGVTQQGFQGDTVLTAVLSVKTALRQSEFGPEQRAGFCLMGACQDCWIWQENGPRLRACSTPLVQGMRLRRAPPQAWP
jgi:hypothetical protein